MTSLRMRVVEAGARAFVAHMMALSEPDNLTLMDEDLEAGEAALDAMLDVLAENADCLELSPESQQPCVLKANTEAHRAGHESAYVNNSRAAWATTEQDWWVRFEALREDR